MQNQRNIFCQNCGTSNESNYNFCVQCGSPLIKTTQQDNAVQQQNNAVQQQDIKQPKKYKFGFFGVFGILATISLIHNFILYAMLQNNTSSSTNYNSSYSYIILFTVIIVLTSLYYVFPKLRNLYKIILRTIGMVYATALVVSFILLGTCIAIIGILT